MLHKNITDAIGNTPLVHIPFHPGIRSYAKLEHMNPGGSMKDRSALFMIEEAERNGLLKPGGTIIEASSGNQGIAAAYIGIAKGYNVIITVSDKVSKEKRGTLEAYGVTVVTCPATMLLTDPKSYHSVACEIQRQTPNSFMLNQYYNQDNLRAHYSLLGPELWRQTEGNITHVVAAAGSGGTISGVGMYLKEQNPAVQVIAVDSDVSFRTTQGDPKPYVLEGMGVDYDTPLLKHNVIDRFMPISDADALVSLRKLARSYGLLAGPASGAVACAAERLAHELQPDDLMVFICGDSGRAYLSKAFYS